jgi:glycosyltransferase involved in cell wall biosynthesis
MAMHVVILTPALVEGDAVSNDVVGMARTLRGMGHRVTLSVRWVSGEFPIVPFNRVPELLTSPVDVLIYHHSINFAEGVRYIAELPCRKIVKYHNVTPPELFRDHNREIARGCAEGLTQVEHLLRPDVPLWADSPFNGRHAQSFRANWPFHTLPPFNQVHELLAAEPDLAGVGLFDDWFTNVLVVGRLVPNKNVTLAIDAFAAYRRKHDPYARLILVGDLAQNAYCKTLLDRIAEHELAEHVVITGKISVAQLKAFFLTAQVLLTTSKHEGFCAPLVEAMALRVPIVALPNGAIPDTAADVALYPQEDAESIADALLLARTDTRGREERLERGWQRYAEHFTNQVIALEFQRLFAEAQGLWRGGRQVPARAG